MKKIMSLLLSGMLMLALGAGYANAGKKKAHQHVQGSILLPTKHPDGCYARLERGVATVGGPTGVLGYTFDVDPKTANKPFALTVDSGEGYVDLDITYYMDFPADPTVAPTSIGFDERSADGEVGIVPAGMTKAIVCIFADENNGPGGNATFSYMAGAGVKAPKR